MKNFRLTPVAGLVAASLMLVACGGGSDDNKNNSANTGNTTTPGGSTGGTTTPGAATATANSVAIVKAAMTGAHEAASAELPAFYANGPRVAMATAPATAKALGGFGQVFTAGTNTATSTRVHLRNFETYVRSAGKWSRVQFSGKLKGATYAAQYAGAAQECSITNNCLRAEDDGGVSFKPVAGRFLRFWPEAAFTQSLVDPTKVEAVFTTVQARLVRDGADDRANAKYLVNTGAVWAPETWTTVDYTKGAYPAIESLNDVGTGRLTLVTNAFTSANFHSATAEAQVDELGVAPAGGKAPLANSQNVRDDDDVVNIQFIGDSITQGNDAQAGQQQDSFRRNLWNSLVQDPSLPMIDFVGTRLGTSLADTNFCQSRGTAVDTGSYKLPEFDTDHQGYWGACVDQVNTLLTPALAALDSDAQRREPDVAVIHIGTNNLNTHKEAGVTAAITQLQTTIAELRKANDDITILVAKVIPFLSGGAASPLVATYNAAIDAQIAPMTTAKSKVIIVDHSAFPVADLRDEFHPNDAGEKRLADTWLAALKNNTSAKGVNLLVDND